MGGGHSNRRRFSDSDSLRVRLSYPRGRVPSFPDMRILLAIATLLLLPHASQAASRACTPSDTTLCLLGGRFSASLQWNDGSGTRDAYVAQSKTDGRNSAAGLFYFYPSDSANWEVLVKVIDGCDSNNRFWTLVSASTGFGWTLSVRDEATGTSKTFSHPLDGKASGVSDFAAFATCGSAPPGPTPAPTPAPAMVRYLNDALCGGGFYSTLEANSKYRWVSLTGFLTVYQPVTPGLLGPFIETNTTVCLNHFYDMTTRVVSGRRYTLQQRDSYAGGSEYLLLEVFDEGPLPYAAPAAAFLGGVSASLAE